VARTPRRILVVDDDRDIAETFALLLRSMGHDAVSLTEPAKAEDYVDALQPHIAFLDIGMPGTDGWTLAARLRARYSADVLKLVAITAYGEEHDRARSRHAGFDAHLLKPASVDLVESILSQFFSPAG